MIILLIKMRSLLGGLLLVVLLLVVSLGVVRGSPGQEDVYTYEEKEALEIFKPLVIPKIPASSQLQKYKNDDLFFVQWLRFKNLDVRGAERMFLQHLRWREQMKMDTILDEDWTEIQRDFPAYTDGSDKAGRPIVEMWGGDFQMRALIVDGKMGALHRFGAASFEAISRRVFEGRAAGKNISQGIGLGEVEEFNLVDQACPRCLPWYAGMAYNLEHHYPNLLDSVYIINIRPVFGLALGVILPNFRPAMRKAIKYYRNKSVWMPILDRLIDRDQRGVKAGGTRVRDLSNNGTRWNY